MRTCITLTVVLVGAPALGEPAAVLDLTGTSLSALQDHAPTTRRIGYLRAGIGPSIFEDSTFTGLGTTDADIDFDPGASSSLAIGADFAGLFYDDWTDPGFRPGLRVEAEFSLQAAGQYDRTGSGGGSTIASGDLASVAVGVNVYADVHFGKRWTAFVGAGIGSAVFGIEDDIMDDPEGSEVAGFRQVMVGGEYAFNERWSIYAMYRGRWHDDAHWEEPEITGSIAEPISHSLEVGAMWRF